MRPQAVAYVHIIAIDDNGNVVADPLDPEGGYPINTSVTKTKAQLYISNLVAPVLGRIEKEKIVDEYPAKTTEPEGLHLEKLIDEIIPCATPNTSIIQSSPVAHPCRLLRLEHMGKHLAGVCGNAHICGYNGSS